MGSDFKYWIIVFENFDGIDFYFTAWDFKILAFSSQFVGTLAVDFDGAEARWGLGDFANEVIEYGFKNIQRGLFRHRVAPARRYGGRALSVSVVTSDRFFKALIWIFLG